ncbi:AgmX/PglI C-terminal domain-containing protein [Sorangium cellulosum]|uniref:AgmX/PglI C-terminal domain-containing protein n=1 Tax=Sorangium cellulosum TaxID=56 RepID=UPI000424AF7C|nr:AgmX/PglI C-terminal domain-containing protein [Sorangium cellulosum]
MKQPLALDPRPLLAAAVALAACAAPPRTPPPAAGLPAPAAVQPARPPRPAGAPAPSVASTAASGAAAPSSPPVPSAAPPAAPSAADAAPPAASDAGGAPGAAAPQGPSIAIEPPYKLGQHPVPRGQAEAAERDRWNAGGRGEPPAPPPPAEGHPLPRIIVDIDKVNGPLKARDVERIARRHLWIHVYGCYRLRAYRDPSLHGKTTVRLTVSRAGKVTGARATSSTLSAPDVVSCLAARARSLPLPRARAGSTVVATLQVYPGDDPVEPPPSVLAPGPGELRPDAIEAAVAEAMPAFRSCYDAALAGAPALWGRLAIRFHVTDSGAVDEAFEVESRFPDERLTRCVLRRARALTFPAPEGGDVRFVVPLRFSPDPQGP